MNRHFKAHIKAAIVPAAAFIACVVLFAGAATALFAQEYEQFPGPIIEEPVVPFSGHIHVVPAANLHAANAQALSTFVVTYNGFTPQAQAAFQAAVDIWASQIQSGVPIRITANWSPLNPNVLGSAGPITVSRNTASNVIYAAALANKLAGVDLAPGLDDIVANFSSTIDWYLGTDGNAGAKYDLETVVLHELAHGLGFIGSMDGSGGMGKWGISGAPFVYDQSAINGSGQFLIDQTLFPNPSAALGAQLTGNNIFFNGPNARNANAGLAPKLYAPDPWAAGSSFSHLDELTYPPGNPNSLMTYRLGPGEIIHDPGAIVRGIFADLGWGIGKKNVRSDYDGDGSVDLTVYRPSNGYWFILRSAVAYSAYNAYAWGAPTDIPVVGDYDGDGLSDLTVYRPSGGNWFVLQSSSNFAAYSTYLWGVANDVPLSGDFDGDGKTDIAVFRPSTGVWYVLRSTSNFTSSASYVWGVDGDTPVPADFDGDGRTDIAVFRPSTGVWYILRSSSNFFSSVSYQWGIAGDVPVAGDFDGDGKADVAIYRPSTGVWYLLFSGANFTTFATYQWGVSGDVAVPGDFDGDGKTDIAVYRPSSGDWFILRSSSGFLSYNIYRWGSTADVPVLRTTR